MFRERAAAQEVLRRRAQLAEPDLATPLRDSQPPERPWWGNPWLWVLVSLASVVLGIFVWPGLFGGTFLFLPFIWVWRPRRGRDEITFERPRLPHRPRLPGRLNAAASGATDEAGADALVNVLDAGLPLSTVDGS